MTTIATYQDAIVTTVTSSTEPCLKLQCTCSVFTHRKLCDHIIESVTHRREANLLSSEMLVSVPLFKRIQPTVDLLIGEMDGNFCPVTVPYLIDPLHRKVIGFFSSGEGMSGEGMVDLRQLYVEWISGMAELASTSGDRGAFDGWCNSLHHSGPGDMMKYFGSDDRKLHNTALANCYSLLRYAVCIDCWSVINGTNLDSNL